MSRHTPLIALLVSVGAIAAFWMIALAPKREQAKELDAQVSKLEASVAEQEQAIAAGLEAKRSFPRDYQQLVLLGKATPEDEDSASLLVQVNEIAAESGVVFRQLELAETTATEAAPAAPPVPAAPTATEPPAEEGATTTTTTTAPAPATEASAASLPIGATVGPAGLGIVPYNLQFQGDFFDTAAFLAGLDRLVTTEASHLAVDGRLITVNGFSFSRDKRNDFPSLLVNLSVTAYVTPDQAAAAVTPVSPPASGTIEATPTSTTTTP